MAPAVVPGPITCCRATWRAGLLPPAPAVGLGVGTGESSLSSEDMVARGSSLCGDERLSRVVECIGRVDLVRHWLHESESSKEGIESRQLVVSLKLK